MSPSGARVQGPAVNLNLSWDLGRNLYPGHHTDTLCQKSLSGDFVSAIPMKCANLTHQILIHIPSVMIWTTTSRHSNSLCDKDYAKQHGAKIKHQNVTLVGRSTCLMCTCTAQTKQQPRPPKPQTRNRTSKTACAGMGRAQRHVNGDKKLWVDEGAGNIWAIIAAGQPRRHAVQTATPAGTI